MKSASKIILTNSNNGVLLQLRDKKHSHAGSWALFGGHIDDSETPEEALVREIKEELGYNLNDYKLLKATFVEDFGTVYWFHGKIDVDISDLTLLEGDDCQFFSYDELLELNIAPESKKRLIEYYEDKNV